MGARGTTVGAREVGGIEAVIPGMIVAARGGAGVRTEDMTGRGMILAIPRGAIELPALWVARIREGGGRITIVTTIRTGRAVRGMAVYAREIPTATRVITTITADIADEDVEEAEGGDEEVGMILLSSLICMI